MVLTPYGPDTILSITAVVDPNAIFLADDAGPDRFIAIGMSASARVLHVVHIERGARDRIISARPATPFEETVYTAGP